MEAMTAGPVVMMGNATGSDNVLLETNQQAVATPHINPEASPGNIAFGYTIGRFLFTAEYIMK